MDLEQALQLLRDNPQTFLLLFCLKVTGPAIQPPPGEQIGGQQQFWFYREPMDFNGIPSYAINTVPWPGVDILPFNAFPLPTCTLGGGPGQENILALTLRCPNPAPAVGGVPMLVTAQLTGCCLVTKREQAGNGPFLAHLQPVAGQNGEELQVQLMHSPTRFHGQNADGLQFYGRFQYPQRIVTVIGVRRPLGWSLFVQPRNLQQIFVEDVAEIPLY